MTPGTVTRRGFLAGLAAMLCTGRQAAAAAACLPTEDNPQGPFYLPGAPFREAIAPGDEPGERLVVTGKVRSAPHCRPLAAAVVDVWHASGAGGYYGLEGASGDDAWRLRGRVRSDKDGAYRFETILPGRYPLSPTRMRPRHIHYVVTHPDHHPLVTQLYFSGDPFLQGDPLVRSSLIVPLTGAGAGPGGVRRYAVAFDVVLASVKS